MKAEEDMDGKNQCCPDGSQWNYFKIENAFAQDKKQAGELNAN